MQKMKKKIIPSLKYLNECLLVRSQKLKRKEAGTEQKFISYIYLLLFVARFVCAKLIMPSYVPF